MPKPNQRAGEPATTTWLEIERAWLGLERPPLPRRLQEAHWTPEPEGAVCPRCGLEVGPFEAAAAGCPRCRNRRLPWQRLIRLGRYESPWRDIVHDIKFTAWRRLGHDAGAMLGLAVRRAIDRHWPASAGPRIIVVPVPTSAWRRLARGIDHTAILAAAVARASGGECWRLLRREHRPSQLAVAPSQRRRNVAGTMGQSWWSRFGRAWSAPNTQGGKAKTLIVVVDDVVTTGATMGEACRAIPAIRRGSKAEEIQIWAATLTVTPDRPAREEGGGETP